MNWERFLSWGGQNLAVLLTLLPMAKQLLSKDTTIVQKLDIAGNMFNVLIPALKDLFSPGFASGPPITQSELITALTAQHQMEGFSSPAAGVGALKDWLNAETLKQVFDMVKLVMEFIKTFQK